MRRNIIVIGKTGQLARALAKSCDGFGANLIFYGREACDLSASGVEITAFAENLPPCDGLIIAAAYTAVDAAESDEATAFQVNAAAPEIFAKLCAARGVPLAHVSTDYVFQGQGDVPIKPGAPVNPMNAYGRSKLAGETAILGAGARAVILRSSWVFDGTGKNFLTTMLRLGETRETLRVVDDQIGRPSYAGHLAQACMSALFALMDDTERLGGVYHVTGGGAPVSWAGFAEAIFSATQEMRAHTIKVKPILSTEYLALAKRPAYSVLDISLFEADFQMKLPDWQAGLTAALNERHADEGHESEEHER